MFEPKSQYNPKMSYKEWGYSMILKHDIYKCETMNDINLVNFPLLHLPQFLLLNEALSSLKNQIQNIKDVSPH